jgi:hypothetical protein
LFSFFLDLPPPPVVVLAKRFPPETSKKGGAQYVRWHVVDMRSDSLERPTTVFIFGRAFE